MVRPLRREPGGFYVRAGHPLARRKVVTLKEVLAHGVLSVRLPKRRARDRWRSS